ncbi:triple tyrosine motif-containing protein [Sphingobacterium bovistauri]|uniref:Transcriptional regulator n=1 Tax=Sphingobacterium bovistauri TaxID=2781959 RepID=A0ABS7Z085_9SPHI|nr:triple tyrosine motif-containing protein [Sphingobacterium bovistauri]MCA5003541.1 transcriptional regulator [Sphingobacterium bovistauri]
MSNKVGIVLISILLFLMPNLGKSQNITSLGTPSVQQYKKITYKAGNQNWSIAFSTTGILYVANTEGLLSYDGTYWSLNQLPNRSTVRSVKISKDNRIYTGGLSEFGFWQRSENGHLQYTSISSLVKDKSTLKNDEIWKIILNGDEVIFQSFSKSYIYKNKQISIMTADGEPFLFAHYVYNNIFYQQIPSGLHVYAHNKLTAVKDKEKLQSSNILSMLPFHNQNTLIATSHNGLYIMDKDQNIKKWDCEASNILAKHQINNGIQLTTDHYAFGTIKNGVYIINKAGKIIQHINKNNGLQNNTVLSLGIDPQQNLWVGLDNGIDCIQINSPLYYYTDIKGEIGTVYTSALFDNKLYLGTNQGLYVCDWKEVKSINNFNFKLIPKSNGHVWSLTIIENQLICGHNEGTFLIKDDSMEKISAITGGFVNLPINNNSHFIQGNYTGLSLFEINNNIKFQKQFSLIKEPIRYAKQYNKNQFWIGNATNFHLVQYNPTTSDITINYSTAKDSTLKNTYFYNLSLLENRLVFTSDTGLYTYDEILKKFVYYEELNKKLNSFKSISQIFYKNQNEYFFAKNASLHIAKFDKVGNINIDSVSLHPLNNKMMKHYENIINIDNSQYLIGLDYGFAIYTESVQDAKMSPPLAPQIAYVTNLSNEKVYYDKSGLVRVPYVANNIRIAYSSPTYHEKLKYQYYLEGYSENWSLLEEESFKDFSNLPYGKFEFKVRAVSINGQVSSTTILFLEIITPWYYSIWMIIIYTLTFLLISYFILKKYKRYISYKKRLVNKKIIEKQQEEISKQAEINEKEIIRLKNFQLEKELEIKNRELSNATTNIVYKNEMLNKLNLELNKLNDSKGIALNESQLNRLNKLIESIQNDNRDWDIFEKSFNDAHENFFKKLKLEYPELVPNDLKLCAYLRLNMSSKEIASLLNISTRGVEIRRYRLRKKLGISTDKNLTEFLLER